MNRSDAWPSIGAMMSTDLESSSAGRNPEAQAALVAAVAAHSGRVLRTGAGSLLADFASVHDALECAAALKASIAPPSPGGRPGAASALRIGICRGEVRARGVEPDAAAVRRADSLRDSAQLGETVIAPVPAGRTTLNSARLAADKTSWRRVALAATVQSALLLGYFLAWYGAITWKTILFALQAS